MNEVVHTSPTIGSNVEEIVINNTRFLMWDIGGQESLRSSWNTYYTNTEVMFLNILKTSMNRMLGKQLLDVNSYNLFEISQYVNKSRV